MTERHRAGLGGAGVYQPGWRSIAERQGRRQPAIPAAWRKRYQLDGDGGQADRDTELEVFITDYTFQKLAFHVILIMAVKPKNWNKLSQKLKLIR